MSHDIKKLKPNRGGRYKQGYVNPERCARLFESQKSKPIIYRSSWELSFINWCETSPNVKHWGSECVPINYILQSDGTEHTYYPDYIVEFKSGPTMLVEIKPWAQTQRPEGNDYSSYAWQTYIKNYSKWKAAVEFCKNNNLKFKILTEKTVSKLK